MTFKRQEITPYRGARSLATLALVLGVLALMLTIAPPRASAANGFCVGTRCEWNCNPQAGSSWCWFDSGGVNARNWFYNDATDFYATHVYKCAAAIRADNGNTWSSQCGSGQTVANSYTRCNCGGLYVRTWNNATGSRNLFSSGES